ncbi:very-long-chain (3R)-3-hydroxyacyl- dehydratase 1 [Labeo rohita]|uniref:Very-long-chain (3R)-3-hydroxyacyl-CoA dehydratase n=1 Tax=Labeo rohita TaxID=84645 RepID=A0A498M850_LABRO|nr:very-long-chain (3R)-3-hydroxyacyl- dehydratase 1 [Labeo rohita]
MASGEEDGTVEEKETNNKKRTKGAIATAWLTFYNIAMTAGLDTVLLIQNEESVILFVVVWTITEITRYSFYTFNLLNHLPYFIKWARYNLFIVMYPLGVIGELLTIHAALPYVRRSGMYSLRLPNKYNVSFDYYYFLIIVMLSYIPLFPQLFFHMLRQRRRVLHGEIVVEKDE